jgi:hypothetical protein
VAPSFAEATAWPGGNGYSERRAHLSFAEEDEDSRFARRRGCRAKAGAKFIVDCGRQDAIRGRTTRKIALGEAYLGAVGEESACAFGTSSTAWLTVPDAFTVTVGAGDVAASASPGFFIATGHRARDQKADNEVSDFHGRLSIQD